MKPADRAAIWNVARLPLFALIALTALLGTTVAVSYVHLGAINLIVALFIAALKVAIIAWIFMELPRAAGFQMLAAGVGMFWLTFLFLLGFTDYLSR